MENYLHIPNSSILHDKCTKTIKIQLISVFNELKTIQKNEEKKMN